MSVKSAKNTSNSSVNNDSSYVEPQFVLKHRIVGAAFLLFFGALFLPWVLGAPGEEKQTSTNLQASDGQAANGGNVASESQSVSNETSKLSSVEELAAAIAGEEIDAEEQVYISKITPLDGSSNTTNDTKAEQSKTKGVADDAAKAQPKVQIAADDKKVQPAQSTKPSSTVSKSETKPSSQAVVKTTPVEKKPEKPTVQEPAAIEVGWIVQVGVFTDKRGAGKVVDDLRSKGFQPSTTIVDTNRGPASGTRIWLGPFSQRVNAAKAKAELTSKTGEAGFIRAYP